MERNTKQRTTITKALSSSGRPLSIEEIQAFAVKEIPEINLSTIYRNLKKLTQEQKIKVIELPGENVRYEMSEKKDHHHHFLCTKCNRLFCLDACPKGLHDLVPKGFILTNHSITLEGICKDCTLT